jgi:hypothetical protein
MFTVCKENTNATLFALLAGCFWYWVTRNFQTTLVLTGLVTAGYSAIAYIVFCETDSPDSLVRTVSAFVVTVLTIGLYCLLFGKGIVVYMMPVAMLGIAYVCIISIVEYVAVKEKDPASRAAGFLTGIPIVGTVAGVVIMVGIWIKLFRELDKSPY